MLIPLETLVEKYDLKITGVIHVGGHFGQELGDYLKYVKGSKVIFIEPCKRAFNQLRHNILGTGAVIHNVACGAEEGEGIMNVETVNAGQSNSLLKPAGHLVQHPSIVFNKKERVQVVTLDSLNITSHNFLNIDVQGYELEVLKGATETLKGVEFLYTEINRADVYQDCAKVWELDEFLTDFERVETAEWVGDWSDAFYIKRQK